MPKLLNISNLQPLQYYSFTNLLEVVVRPSVRIVSHKHHFHVFVVVQETLMGPNCTVEAFVD